ncbi:MAG: 3-deoxy-manno-octulosonate cytidylyltransferase [Verrucomicrobia bacterium]|nr:MAG: 3-deoxy-manno-octulosonate cytidylyltransferase [Verrucomicrobiota bacterium]
MAASTAIIVPARLASTRFPRKLLHEVHGKPIIVWTAERVRREAPEFPLYFAVDDPSLRDALASAGFDSIMTSPEHACGTDRIAEANREIGAEIVLNVQADEPLTTGGQIRQMHQLIQQDVELATLGSPLESEADFLNPNHVKCVCDRRGRALYFSRAPMPHFRDGGGRFDPALAATVPVLIHLGLYAYRADFLAKFSSLPQGPLEQIERLEMLRVLENGYRIQVGVSQQALIEIDTPEQAQQFAEYLSANNLS